MAEDKTTKHRHIFPPATGKTLDYKTPASRRGGKSTPPGRTRGQHAQLLMDSFSRVSRAATEAKDRRQRAGIDADGDIISFEVIINQKLNLDSLENRRAGTRLLSFHPIDEDVGDDDEQRGIATVFVPYGQLELYQRKIEEYRDKETPTGKPKHEPLINSVNEMRRAKLADLWTDALEEEPPTGTDAAWWEVWVRDEVSEQDFKTEATKLRLRVKEQVLRFPGRLVFIVNATPDQMAKAVDLLDVFAELRRARPVDHEFVAMSRKEEREWCEDMVKRTSYAPRSCPCVCVLDTGVDHGHMLLAGSITRDDVHTYDRDWGTHDHYEDNGGDGHGTPMAGFALFGERLAEHLVSAEPLELRHRLESVKIMPPSPQQNEPESYGEVTQSAVAIAEVGNPDRRRVLSMAITSAPVPDGSPSSWSAAIDQICSGAVEDDRPRRLFFIAGGNANCNCPGYSYPDDNQTAGVQDPAQAWNAVTVGAYTDRTAIEPTEEFPDWRPVAPAGDMSPSNSTSLTWEKDWPSKPDIVVEGGNRAWEPGQDVPSDGVDSLLLLTTRRVQAGQPLTTLSGDTSAATSIAAGLAAQIYAEYPNLWPETVRALLIHSARWTPQMEAQFADVTPRTRVRNLLRSYGYGVPDLGQAISSLDNAVTLVVEDELQPFEKDGSRYKTKEMKVHEVPWPNEALEQLGDAEVRLRVTLSYFIEPNPAKRGWTSRYRYMSHGLRYRLRTPEESDEHFLKRINEALRDEDEKVTGGSDSDSWRFWEEAERGSIHSDVWQGPAAKLLDRNLVAVYPVIGWWREYTSQKRWDQTTKYALVVSIETDETDVDLYTEVMNQVGVDINVEA